MLLIILLMSILFILIGQFVDLNNIGVLLKGSKQASQSSVFLQKQQSFLRVFRQFHTLLGLSFGALGIFSHFTFGWSVTLNMVVLTPIIAYLFFFYRYEAFFYPRVQRSNRMMMLLLGSVLLLGGWLAFTTWGNNHLEIGEEGIRLRGPRGYEIYYDQIAHVDTVYELPIISQKYLASSETTIPTLEGQMIQVVINPSVRPYLSIKLKNGKAIYYSSRFQSSNELLTDLKQQLSQKK